MCGIIGGIFREKRDQVSFCESLEYALHKIAYRGPDGSGIWHDDQVYLGHRRLSIIDLSAAGAQPFESKEFGLVITYNGEIYNYQEIRAVLRERGYAFRSQTDTEVLLYAYDFYGIDFLKHLKGMFAFCLYDQKRRKIILARDPIGEKPLFYYANDQRIVFSSEVKAFHAFPDIPLQIDLKSLESYLVLQYIPGEHTIYDNIKEIAPGTALEIDLDRWHTNEFTYWSIAGEKGIDTPSNAEEIEQLLAHSTQGRLVGDVKIGLLLSGGIDSSLIAWHVRNQGGNLMAFTAQFEREELDELPYAQKVAGALGMELVQINGGILTSDTFEDIIYHADEPIGDAACIPTYMLAKELSNYVTVVLSGEGADELFFGYDFYRYEIQARKWRRLIDWLRRNPMIANSARCLGSSPMAGRRITRPAKILFDLHDLGVIRWTSVFLESSVNKILADGMQQQGSSAYLQEIEDTMNAFRVGSDRSLAPILLDLSYWLPDDLLMKVDRMTMAHSVEARTPFLDPDLIKAALQLPVQERMNRKTGKIILRKFFENKFPPEIAQQLAWRKKHGFMTPVDVWLKGPLREIAEERFSPAWVARQGIFNPREIQNLWQAFQKRGGKASLRNIWLLLCFQSWYAQHEQKFGFVN